MSKKVTYIDKSGKSASVSSSASNTSTRFNLDKTDEDIEKKYQEQKTPYKFANNEKFVNDISPYDRKKLIEMHKAPTIKFNSTDLYRLHKTLSIYDSPAHSANWQWDKSTEYYNRFKVQTLDDMLAKGFAHVIFVKPNCNILSSSSQLASGSGLSNNQMFQYALKNTPSLLQELCQISGHTFMLSLSNKVTGFNVNEEYLADGTYGKTYTGHQIAYGKNNIESQTASQLGLDFQDDKYLHVYQLHKLWIEYISGCYRGTIIPTTNTIVNKILDYAGAIYYILTAEDGETIIYWEKYYGIFPSNISTDSLSWNRETPVSTPKFSVTYKYSFKKTFDPSIFIEFNHNANINSSSNLVYAPVFDKKLGHTGSSWVGVPYIELDTGDSSNDNAYTYKLRFTYKKSPTLSK